MTTASPRKLLQCFITVLLFCLASSRYSVADVGPCQTLMTSLLSLSSSVKAFVDTHARPPSVSQFRQAAASMSLAKDPWGRDWGYDESDPLHVYTTGEDGISGTADDVSLEPLKSCPYDTFAILQIDGKTRVIPIKLPRVQRPSAGGKARPAVLVVLVLLGAVVALVVWSESGKGLL
jgi:hypothetical protein